MSMSFILSTMHAVHSYLVPLCSAFCRFLREHARKALDEDNTFVRALRAEDIATGDMYASGISPVYVIHNNL